MKKSSIEQRAGIIKDDNGNEDDFDDSNDGPWSVRFLGYWQIPLKHPGFLSVWRWRKPGIVQNCTSVVRVSPHFQILIILELYQNLVGSSSFPFPGGFPSAHSSHPYRGVWTRPAQRRGFRGVRCQPSLWPKRPDWSNRKLHENEPHFHDLSYEVSGFMKRGAKSWGLKTDQPSAENLWNINARGNIDKKLSMWCR